MGNSLIDLSALGQPATKLIEVVSSAVGVLYEPTRIRRKAKADADAQLLMQVGKIEQEELARRAAKRIASQEMRRQTNIESILSLAIEDIAAHESEVAPDIDPDWIAHFFDDCKDVSDEEMQILWARLLGQEVLHRRSCSRATLQTLKRMDRDDARLFAKYSQFVMRVDNVSMRPRFSYLNKFLDTAGITEGEILHLNDLGLTQEFRIFHFTRNTSYEIQYLVDSIFLTPRNPRQVKVENLTRAGAELLPVATKQQHNGYFLLFLEHVEEWANISHRGGHDINRLKDKLRKR